MSCVISVQRKHVSGQVHVDVRVDKPDPAGGPRSLHVTVDGQDHTLTGDGTTFLPSVVV